MLNPTGCIRLATSSNNVQHRPTMCNVVQQCVTSSNNVQHRSTMCNIVQQCWIRLAGPLAVRCKQRFHHMHVYHFTEEFSHLCRNRICIVCVFFLRAGVFVPLPLLIMGTFHFPTLCVKPCSSLQTVKMEENPRLKRRLLP